MDEKEIPLPGGNVNLNVVRVGNTVRRSTTGISPTVHQLLLHLEAKGFAGCPRFLGIDDKQREILSFLEGETGTPTYIWRDDKPLIAAARLLRAYHDATLDFAKNTSMIWGITHPDPSRHEVICHNDFGPYNFIYRSQSPYAVIDFDLIGPGPRLSDIAYAAYWLTPLSFNSDDQLRFSEADIQNGSRRLHLFCETYGTSVNEELLDMAYEKLCKMGNKKQVQKIIGHEAAHKLDTEGHLAHWQRESQSFLENRSRLESNLREA
ncbi:MAG: aminoglycoside phosphotransferase family protein [Anaerolineaceae bacterium]|nr:aminoglycoside phosphotransferase family protein [Anaerolineaceae bacterium]